MKVAIAQAHWDYFLSLEEDLIDVFKFVEPDKCNSGAYGPLLVKLFLAIGSEIDVTMKDFIGYGDLSKKKASKSTTGIKEFRIFVQDNLPDEFDNVEVSYSRSETVYTPWNSWWKTKNGKRVNTERNPEWWQSYNDVKHNRVDKYYLANLGNILNAMAALFIVITSLHRHTIEPKFLDPIPKVIKFTDNRFGHPDPLLELHDSGQLTMSDHLVFNTKSES